jgi:hypothetical protein
VSSRRVLPFVGTNNIQFDPLTINSLYVSSIQGVGTSTLNIFNDQNDIPININIATDNNTYLQLTKYTNVGNNYNTSVSLWGNCNVNVYANGGLLSLNGGFATVIQGSNYIDLTSLTEINLQAPSAGITLSQAAIDLSVVGGDIVCLTNSLRPYTDNAIDLGNTSYYWKDIYYNNLIQASDERKKTEIQSSDLGLNFITQLSSAKYKFKVGQNIQTHEYFSTFSTIVSSCIYETVGNSTFTSTCGFISSILTHSTIVTPRAGVRTHYGLLAQQVRSTLNTLGVSDFAGFVLADKNDPTSDHMLNYIEFIAPMIKSIQELNTIVQAQQSTINALVARM